MENNKIMIGGREIEYSEYVQKMKEYYWKCFFSEFSKICIFFVIFAFLGLIPEYLIALLCLMPLRSHGGGLHFNHYISCLAVSFSFLSGSIILAANIMPPKAVMLPILLLCILAGYFLVPVTSANRPPATAVQIQKSKRTTVVLLVLFFALVCICPANGWIYIGYWTVILHIVQLAIARGGKEVKRNV
ncbi:MAG: accessory gene regulator B family protein [Lachnospiraceae bacterium]|nr:accessory gene regulator B family protein [Lachnospiraceae bacterium]